MYEKCKKLWLTGMTLTSIENLTGFNRKLLSYLLRREGFKTNKNISDEKKVTIVYKKKSGMGNVQIALEENIDRHTVLRILRNEGIIDNKIPSNICSIKNKYDYNETVFKTIDSEKRAYWLGFLYADGCITNNGIKKCITLCLKKSDEDHLRDFCSFIGNNLRIKYRTLNIKGKTYESCSTCVSNGNLVEDLINCGCTPRKCLTLEFPNFIDDNLIRHFMRGYFDGDGSCFVRTGKMLPSISILGTYQFIYSFRSILNNIGVPQVKIRIKGKISSIEYNSFYDTLLISNYLYNNCSISLERKSSFLKQYYFPNLEKQYKSNFFKEIKTEVQSYFLGLIFSKSILIKTSNLNYFSIEFTDSYKLIKCLSDNLGINLKIKERSFYDTNNINHQIFTLIINDKSIVDDLINLGCPYNSSNEIRFPKLEDCLINHLMAKVI